MDKARELLDEIFAGLGEILEGRSGGADADCEESASEVYDKVEKLRDRMGEGLKDLDSDPRIKRVMPSDELKIKVDDLKEYYLGVGAASSEEVALAMAEHIIKHR